MRRHSRTQWLSRAAVAMVLSTAAASSWSGGCEDLAIQALRGQFDDGRSGPARAALTAAFRESLGRHDNAFPNEAVRTLLADPVAVAPEAWRLPAVPDGAIPDRVAALRLMSGWAASEERQRGLDPLSPFSMAGLEALLKSVDDAVERAFADVVAQDRDALIGSLPRLLGQPAGTGEDDALAELAVRVARAADLAALPPLLDRLLAVAGDQPVDELRRELSALSPISRPGWLSGAFDGDLLMARRTPAGPLLVGGRGPNTYGEPAWLIVDLDGNDLYAASAPWVIDLGGDDRYLAAGDAALGAGLFGAGLLFDAWGDDRYGGGRIAQGAALYGIGVTWDAGGDDEYVAHELAQGAALFGAGLLVDAGGDDHFSATRLAQGLGGPAALGALLDAAGDDRYVAGGKFPSGYGTPTNYQAISQGVGLGQRQRADGGVGVLWDGGGDDRYLAGNFAQGTGYYLGLGLLADDDGDDRYLGSRYAQGSSAHLGVGLLVDRAGDDHYRGKTAANQGAAWDLSVAALVDCVGDDDYAGGELALGAGEQNGIGWLFDAAGKDRYAGRAKAFGFSGATTYQDGRGAGNLGVFIDDGGEEDSYPADDRAGNTRASRRGDLGVFVDR